MAPRRRRRRWRAGVAIALALGIFAGLVFFAVGASVLWAAILGFGAFGMSFGASFLVGGSEGTDLDEGTGVAGLSGGDDLGDV